MVHGAVAFRDGIADVIGEVLVVVGNEVGLLQKSAAGTDFAGESCDRGIRAVEARIVVVDEIAEQAVLPLRHRSEAQRDWLGVDNRSVDRFLNLELDAGAKNHYGMTDEKRQVLVGRAREGIDGP